MECGFQKVFNFGGTLWGTPKNVALVDTIGIAMIFRGVHQVEHALHIRHLDSVVRQIVTQRPRINPAGKR